MKGTCAHCGQQVEHLCVWCGEPAIAFCDGWIGSEMKDGFFTLDGDHFLCDAPICQKHRTTNGWVCGENPDTFDYCPTHAKQRTSIRDAATNRADADMRRRAVWAEGLRNQIR